MSIARQQAVLSTLPAGFRPFDVSNEILKIRPADTLLLTLLMALNKVTVDSRQFIINQQEMDVSTFTISAIGNGQTANVLTTTSQDEVDAVEVGMNVRKDYETVALVVDVNTTDKKITVDDASGFTANDVLVMGGAASEENSNRPTPTSRIPEQVTNYAECSRDAFGQSRWVETENFYGPPREQENRDLMLFEHKRFINRSLFVNKKALTTQNGQTIYKTGGLFDQISTNKAGFASGVLTYNGLRTLIETHSRFMQSSVLWLFVSRHGSSLIDQMSYGKIVPNIQSSTAFGVVIKELLVGNKKLKIMEEDCLGDGALAESMVVVDPAVVEIVTCRNQKTGVRQWMIEETDARTPGQDGSVGCVTTDFGLRLKNEKACAIWYDAATVA